LQPHYGLNARMKLTLPKVGTWSPPRLPKTQSLIVGVKTPCIEVFLISLKRSWSVDVQNGLAWVIWTSVAQVMGKRRVGSSNRNNFGTVSGLHFGSPETKKHLGVGAVEQCRKYYMGEGGGFPRVRAVVSQVSPRLPVAYPNTKRVQNEL
jgi:hypothetical protein